MNTPQDNGRMAAGEQWERAERMEMRMRCEAPEYVSPLSEITTPIHKIHPDIKKETGLRAKFVSTGSLTPDEWAEYNRAVEANKKREQAFAEAAKIDELRTEGRRLSYHDKPISRNSHE